MMSPTFRIACEASQPLVMSELPLWLAPLTSGFEVGAPAVPSAPTTAAETFWSMDHFQPTALPMLPVRYWSETSLVGRRKLKLKPSTLPCASGLITKERNPAVWRNVELVEVTACPRVVPARVQLSPETQHLRHTKAPVQGPFLIEISDAFEQLDVLRPWRLAEHADLSGARGTDPGEHPQQGGLPGTVRTDESRDPAQGQAERAVL